jgi:beta-galactosidase
VQPIDDWNRNFKLGLLVEAKVGAGKLMAASMDLETDLAGRVVARQLRASVLAYMASDGFDPQTVVSAAEFRNTLFDTLVMKKLGASASDAAAAIDGDPNTFWSANGATKALTIDFPQAVEFSGLVVMPRQNHRDHEGDVRDYLLEASDNGADWRELKRGALVSTYDQQRIDLGRTINARHLRFTALSGFGADKTAAIAELALIYKGPPLPENSGGLDYKRVKSTSSDIDENLSPEIVNDRQKRK